MNNTPDLEAIRLEYMETLRERLKRISMDMESVKSSLICVREPSRRSDKRLEKLFWDELDALMKVRQCIEKHAIMCGFVWDNVSNSWKEDGDGVEA